MNVKYTDRHCSKLWHVMTSWFLWLLLPIKLMITSWNYTQMQNTKLLGSRATQRNSDLIIFHMDNACSKCHHGSLYTDVKFENSYFEIKRICWSKVRLNVSGQVTIWVSKNSEDLNKNAKYKSNYFGFKRIRQI